MAEADGTTRAPRATRERGELRSSQPDRGAAADAQAGQQARIEVAQAAPRVRYRGLKEQTDAVAALIAAGDPGASVTRQERRQGAGEGRGALSVARSRRAQAGELGEEGGELAGAEGRGVDGEGADADHVIELDPHAEGHQSDEGHHKQEGNEGDDDDDGAHEGDDSTLTEADVRKGLGVSREVLNTMRLQVGDKTMTLGELKAKLPALAKLDASVAEFDERRGRQELEAIDTHRRILALARAFPPGSVPPQLVRQIEAEAEETRTRESGLLHAARPQWSDQTYATAQRQQMGALAKRYGFTTAELASIVDHRQVLLLQDFAALQKKFDDARASSRRVETGNDKTLTRETARQAPREGAPTNAKRYTRTEEISAKVASIIRNG